MASGVRKWDSAGTIKAARREMWRRVEAAATHVEGVAVQLISKDQPIRRSKSGRMVGLAPAMAGQPPKVLHGRLRQSVTHEVSQTRRRVSGRIGTNVIYGRVHEYGAHPWLRPALLKSRRTLRRILGAK